jgi:glutaminyl-tRNA synthetase
LTEGEPDKKDLEKVPTDFLREMIREDIRDGKNNGHVITRFPPEPSGYLHIGHAFAINVNFGIAAEIEGALYNLRFDDTNPEAEETEYVEAIAQDIRWLGFDWGDRLFFASDYFPRLYAYAEGMVDAGLAYVDSCDGDAIRENRGNFYKPGVDCAHRERSIEENRELLGKMRSGDFEDGAHVLRAKIDMQNADLNMRDPLMYRIRRAHHQRTGDEWPIYPLYDFSHGLSDSIEGVTHSLCSLEFLDHRPLYDWFLEACKTENRPQQTEFARLNLTYTVTSKRKLLQLVNGGHVSGWDDPRMPTLRGMRRLGYPPEAIRRFCSEVGITKRDAVIDIGRLEHTVRDHLNSTCPRVMGVLHPLKLVIENFPDDQTEELDCPHHPGDESFGSRTVPFSKVVYVERDDFMENPGKKWHRLGPGREVRLKYACLVTCTRAIKNDDGEIIELRANWDPESLGGAPADGRKVRGTIHWVSAAHAVEAQVSLYDRLFGVENPGAEDDLIGALNAESLETLTECVVEPSLSNVEPGAQVQFERLGYFVAEPVDTQTGRLSFIKTVGLRDAWAKKAK